MVGYALTSSGKHSKDSIREGHKNTHNFRRWHLDGDVESGGFISGMGTHEIILFTYI
jgi:hypothetical protein